MIESNNREDLDNKIDENLNNEVKSIDKNLVKKNEKRVFGLRVNTIIFIAIVTLMAAYTVYTESIGSLFILINTVLMYFLFRTFKTDKVVRSDERTLWGLKVNGPVSIISVAIVAQLVIVTIIVGEPIAEWFKETQEIIADKVGWFFILLVNTILIFSLFLAFGRYKNIKIGGSSAKPEFSNLSWYSMLMSAGMGIGLLFYGVAEPILHFNDNPYMGEGGAADVTEAAKSAMGITFLHWGIHAWALYAVVGVAMAFFTYNRKLPLTIRSIFYPLLGDKIYGPIGDIIDSVSVMATICGLATSLGLGAQQINSGLEYLFNMPNNIYIQITIIVLVTIMATLSLVLGMDRGIRMLSEWNIKLAIFLLLFILAVGPTLFILNAFVENIGHYVYEFFELSFWTNSYNDGGDIDNSWHNSWTVFYWAWWIAWCPFVGTFIARISKGRTIREFILGVIVIPSLFTFIWFSVFGGSAIYQELIGNHSITDAVTENMSTALFYLLEQYPFTSFASIVAVILVASFFITSSDSGSYVVDTLTSGGRQDAPKGQKVFWASMEGIVASVLLLGGGLYALQTATILTGLPFAIIIGIMCFSFYKSLGDYADEQKVIKKAKRDKKRKSESRK